MFALTLNILLIQTIFLINAYINGFLNILYLAPYLLAILISLPGAFIVYRRFANVVQIINDYRNNPLPEKLSLLLIKNIKDEIGAGIFWSAGVAAVSSYAISNYNDPFIMALITTSDNLWQLFLVQVNSALIYGIPATISFLIFYYLVFRPLMDIQTAQIMDRLRKFSGFWGRLLFGGATEEIIIRFGLQIPALWILQAFIESSYISNCSAIIIANFIFIYFNLGGYLLAGCRSLSFFATLFLLHGSILFVFGWLFWHYGIVAAIAAHTLHQFIWIIIEKNLGD